MSLEVIYGETRHRDIAVRLASAVERVASDGTIYLGYPVLASADESVFVDALLLSSEHGLVAFLLAEGLPGANGAWDEYVREQDRLYGALESNLGRHEGLRSGRRLAFDIQTVSVFATQPGRPPIGTDGLYCGIDEVADVVELLPAIDGEILRRLQAAVQRVTTIKPAKRRAAVVRPNSRGAVLKQIEKGIANLDRWQKQAAIETPEGPQRIRGLAGSGKTIVLALKAAYLHSQHSDWQVIVTFQSRALYQQLEDLVTRFSFEHSNDKPDFDRLRIMHAWGAASRPGVYYTMARALGVTPRDFAYARETFGMDDAFRGVCAELLALASQSKPAPLFDAVLIDEAQDFPPEFFKLVHLFTKHPKRIVWAFDELQRLSEAAMPTTDELFGTSPSGESLVSLVERPGEARRDIVLPVCYRNSPWALATAHAVGLGIYRADGLVQHFDDPQLWTNIGYNVLSGSLEEGSTVTLERARDSYPEYFPQLLDPHDAVYFRSFQDEQDQDSWLAESILMNLERDELELDDILIVLPDTYTAKRRSARLARVLGTKSITSHLAGVGSSVDEVFLRDSVAMAHIFRAKGNEAPMVYVVDAHYAVRGTNQITRRNTLFTAITRSRAWVRICGWGDQVAQVADEVERVRDAEYRLEFRIPTADELARLRRLHRERSDAEEASLKKATRGARALVDAFESGELALEDLPPNVRTRLLRLIREDHDAAFDAGDS